MQRERYLKTGTRQSDAQRQRYRDLSLKHWIAFRLRRGDTVEEIEGALARALHAPGVGEATSDPKAMPMPIVRGA